MFCCDGMKSLIANAGQRGISVLVYNTSSGFRFNIQGRAISKEDENRLAQHPTPNPTPLTSDGHLTISANCGLNYCPFCGTKLQKLITRSTVGRFQALAEQHSSIDQRPF